MLATNNWILKFKATIYNSIKKHEVIGEKMQQNLCKTGPMKTTEIAKKCEKKKKEDIYSNGQLEDSVL